MQSLRNLRRLVNPRIFSDPLMMVQKRFAIGFKGTHHMDSKLVQGPENYTGVEKSYKEWSFVERLLPPKYVPPCPTDASVEHPSGWKPQNLQDTSKLQYLVRRTRNHMIPVYLKIFIRGQMRYTQIKFIEGNIWALEKDIGEFLQQKYPHKYIVTHAHETLRYIKVRQDYRDDIHQWLLDRGF